MKWVFWIALTDVSLRVASLEFYCSQKSTLGEPGDREFATTNVHTMSQYAWWSIQNKLHIRIFGVNDLCVQARPKIKRLLAGRDVIHGTGDLASWCPIIYPTPFSFMYRSCNLRLINIQCIARGLKATWHSFVSLYQHRLASLHTKFSTPCK